METSRHDQSPSSVIESSEAMPSADVGPAWPTPPDFTALQAEQKPVIAAQVSASSFQPTEDDKIQGSSTDQRLWRRARWSPDGSHVLAQTESHELDLFALSDDPSSSQITLKHLFRVSSPTTLLDFIWYPFAEYTQPTTWCFLFSSKDVPIKLIDAYNGTTRATYAIIDHIERVIGPHALASSPDGTHIYGGHGNALSIFATGRPGVQTCSTLPLMPNRAAGSSGRTDLQKGIVSTLATTINYAQERQADGQPTGDMIAVGTFAGTIGIYSRPANAQPGQWSVKKSCLATDLCVSGWIETEGSGISQLKFHPQAPYLLFASLRNSPKIKCYDLRYLSTVPNFLEPSSENAVLAIFLRQADENGRTPSYKQGHESQQRLYFDIDWTGKSLIAGNTEGQVRLWSLTDDEAVEEVGQDEGKIRRPLVDGTLSRDAISSVSFHPLRKLLLSTSGSRRWNKEYSNSDSSSSSDNDDEPSTTSDSSWFVRDAQLTIWQL